MFYQSGPNAWIFSAVLYFLCAKLNNYEYYLIQQLDFMVFVKTKLTSLWSTGRHQSGYSSNMIYWIYRNNKHNLLT